MAAVRLRFMVLGICAAFVAGCGGGGSGGSLGGGGGTGGGGGDNPSVVTIAFKGDAPTVVAAQIGSGAYTLQTLSGTTLTLTVPNGTSNYAVAYLCPAFTSGQYSSQFEYVWEASTTDGSSLNLNCPYTPNLSANLTGSLDASAVPNVQSFEILAQNGNNVGIGYTNSGTPNTFNFPAPAGSDRVMALAYPDQTTNPVAGNEGPLAVKSFESVTVPGALNSGNPVVFGASDETTPEALTYNNVPPGFGSPSTYAWFGMGAPNQDFVYATDATTQYLQLPASATDTGDVYFLDANSNSVTSDSSVNTEVVTSGGPVSFTFPAPWSYSGPAAAPLPSFTMDYTGFSGKSNVVQLAWILWNPTPSNLEVSENIQLEATANYQGSSTTLTIPDLSGVTGMMAPPASGSRVQWSAWIEQQSWALESAMPSSATFSSVSNTGLYTVP